MDVFWSCKPFVQEKVIPNGRLPSYCESTALQGRKVQGVCTLWQFLHHNTASPSPMSEVHTFNTDNYVNQLIRTNYYLVYIM